MRFILGLLIVLPTATVSLAADARLLVLSKPGSSLAIVDPESLEVIARVPTGDNPHEVCASGDGKLAIVANYGAQTPGSTLSIIDIAAAKEIRRVDLSPLKRPHGLWESGGKVYFTSEVSCAVARYDLASDKIDWMCGTGEAGTHMLAFDGATGRIYTTNLFGDSVSVIDTFTGAGPPPSPTTISVAGQPEGLALSPDGKELWVASRAGGPISVIDTSNDSIRQTIPCKGMPIRLHFTADGKRVLATDAANHELAIFDAATRAEIKRIQLGQVPIGIVVAPDDSRAFVACAGAGKVYVIELPKLEVTGSFDAGEGPDGMIWADLKPAPRQPKKPGVLGVAVAPLTDEIRKEHNLADGATGVVLQQISQNSPAAQAGLKIGDVILAMNGKAVVDAQHFVRVVRRARAGDVINFDLLRNEERVTIQVTLGTPPG